MPSAFRAESRSVQRFVGLPGVPKARLWPTVDAILMQYRADHEEIGDSIVLGALNSALTSAIMDGRYHEVYDSLGKLLGLHVPSGKSTTGVTADAPGGSAVPIRDAKKPGARLAR